MTSRGRTEPPHLQTLVAARAGKKGAELMRSIVALADRRSRPDHSAAGAVALIISDELLVARKLC